MQQLCYVVCVCMCLWVVFRGSLVEQANKNSQREWQQIYFMYVLHLVLLLLSLRLIRIFTFSQMSSMLPDVNEKLVDDDKANFNLSK